MKERPLGRLSTVRIREMEQMSVAIERGKG